MNINEKIINLLKRRSEVPAIIIHSKNKAALMMPIKEKNDYGNNYIILNNLGSLADAILIASELGNWANGVDFYTKEMIELPENPEFILCAIFINEFCQ